MEWSALNVMDLLTFDLWPFKRVDQKHRTSWEAETDSIFPFPLLPFTIFMLWQLPLHQRAPAISNLYPNLFLSWEFSLSLLYYLLPISYDKYLNTSRFPPLSFNLSFILHPSFLHLLPPSLCSFFLPFSSPVPLSPSVSIFPSEFLSLFPLKPDMTEEYSKYLKLGFAYLQQTSTNVHIVRSCRQNMSPALQSRCDLHGICENFKEECNKTSLAFS